MARNEQVSKNGNLKRSGRYTKRQTARWLRRLAKRHPSDAPRRRCYSGWDG